MLNICNCETCEFNKHVEQLIELVGDSVIRKQLREAFDTLNGKNIHLNMDYEWLTAIVENTWPSAEEQMKNRGWVREDKVQIKVAIPEGYALVPIEPTERMLHASYREASVYSPTAYRAMVNAAELPSEFSHEAEIKLPELPYDSFWEIRSTLRTGEVIYQGPGRWLRWTNTGAFFLCPDGKEREIRDKDNRYDDHARRIS